jgi:hypothetical protein
MPSPKLQPCDATYIGLHNWSNAVFEKLGLMMLAKEHKHVKNIAAYKESIAHLIASLATKIEQIDSNNKKADLRILHANALVLQKCVSKML